MKNENLGTFTLKDNSNGSSWELPVIKGTAGPKVIDVRRLYADTDCFTYDPGFTSTGSCDSKITYIDGEKRKFRKFFKSFNEDVDWNDTFQSDEIAELEIKDRLNLGHVDYEHEQEGEIFIKNLQLKGKGVFRFISHTELEDEQLLGLYTEIDTENRAIKIYLKSSSKEDVIIEHKFSKKFRFNKKRKLSLSSFFRSF